MMERSMNNHARDAEKLEFDPSHTRYLGYRSVSGGYNYKISENYSTDRTRSTHTNHGHGKNGQLVARGACSRLWHHSATVSGSWVDPVDP